MSWIADGMYRRGLPEAMRPQYCKGWTHALSASTGAAYPCADWHREQEAVCLNEREAGAYQGGLDDGRAFVQCVADIKDTDIRAALFLDVQQEILYGDTRRLLEHL
jgi:hypothetical protein